MAAASRSLATALSGARFASGLLQPSYTTKRDATVHQLFSRHARVRSPDLTLHLEVSIYNEN